MRKQFIYLKFEMKKNFKKIQIISLAYKEKPSVK
jgi:hypothetical protein